ncbi:MAG: 2-oxoacid:acceptor oxidoreductase family protein [Clostridia bacterium]|nr:2-oxoacid:acceptor oxidoreductase family protein [Clostridia bacterium]
MLEIRFQGRGGQGAQTAGYILAEAFFQTGKYVQAFSTYGGARRGTPVSTFIRVDDKPIRLRCDIEKPNVVVCFDPSLLTGNVLNGADENTIVLINSQKSREYFREYGNFKLYTIDGLDIARKNNLGRIVNSALIGAFAKLLNAPELKVVEQVVEELSPVKKAENIRACQDGYLQVAGA